MFTEARHTAHLHISLLENYVSITVSIQILIKIRRLTIAVIITLLSNCSSSNLILDMNLPCVYFTIAYEDYTLNFKYDYFRDFQLVNIILLAAITLK